MRLVLIAPMTLTVCAQLAIPTTSAERSDLVQGPGHGDRVAQAVVVFEGADARAVGRGVPIADDAPLVNGQAARGSAPGSSRRAACGNRRRCRALRRPASPE